ncbi:MAG: ImmA/IrrE family metallo-endopeptidase [Candidatus Brocadia sp. BROELEC01]|nr:ImmA/IrrE family metallo-endopeptidase [Candidatus Brocadia sapporoensis]QQR66593.1 MAG: ImmA/IrrE family metallo-endopeptidase [Candidatus Brocadia sp.]RZV59436.1 MAG: ImmA/IrrE family metallo-endopeptidase [Candidatus Brocadia sp. BROELEC01]
MVENNTHRPLNSHEFRGLVLTGNYARYIFIHGKDFTAAKMFALAHELVHIWLGKSAAPATKKWEQINDRAKPT